MKDAYSKHLGHKCTIERFLVVGEGGLAATLRRIPHMVTLFNDSMGTLCLKATQPAETTKQEFQDADSNYRRELIRKKSAMVKAKADAAAKAPSVVGNGAAVPAVASPTALETTSKAASPIATVGDKRPPPPAAGTTPPPEAKKPKAAAAGAADVEALAKMLMQGVVRVLQNRAKAGKGDLPLSELPAEFKTLWKLPFDPRQAGESDAVSLLQKWPHKVELRHDGEQHLVRLVRPAGGKAKAAVLAEVSDAPAAAAPARPARVPPAGQPAPAAAEAPPAAAPAGAAAAMEAAAAEAAELVAGMREMARRQEELAGTLRKLSAGLR